MDLLNRRRITLNLVGNSLVSDRLIRTDMVKDIFQFSSFLQNEIDMKNNYTRTTSSILSTSMLFSPPARISAAVAVDSSLVCLSPFARVPISICINNFVSLWCTKKHNYSSDNDSALPDQVAPC